MANASPSLARWHAPKLQAAFDLQQALDHATREAAEYLQQRVADSYVVSFGDDDETSGIRAVSYFNDEPELSYNTRQILGFQARQMGRKGLVVDGTV